jgi:hypothetical protein
MSGMVVGVPAGVPLSDALLLARQQEQKAKADEQLAKLRQGHAERLSDAVGAVLMNFMVDNAMGLDVALNHVMVLAMSSGMTEEALVDRVRKLWAVQAAVRDEQLAGDRKRILAGCMKMVQNGEKIPPPILDLLAKEFKLEELPEELRALL